MLSADLFHSDIGLKISPDDSRTFWLTFVWFKSTADFYHVGNFGEFFGLLSLFLTCDTFFCWRVR